MADIIKERTVSERVTIGDTVGDKLEIRWKLLRMCGTTSFSSKAETGLSGGH